MGGGANITNNNCETDETNGLCEPDEYVSLLAGEAVIFKTETNNYQLLVKSQMSGGIFDNPQHQALLTSYKYIFTQYPEFSINAIDPNSNTIELHSMPQKIDGRNATERTNNTTEYTYELIVKSGNTLQINSKGNNNLAIYDMSVVIKTL